MAKDPYLGSTHCRNSAISEFRKNKLRRVGYEGQLLGIKTQLRGAGRALTSPHFEKCSKAPTSGQRIFGQRPLHWALFCNFGKINCGALAFAGQLLGIKTQLREAGGALTLLNFEKWSKTPGSAHVCNSAFLEFRKNNLRKWFLRNSS